MHHQGQELKTACALFGCIPEWTARLLYTTTPIDDIVVNHAASKLPYYKASFNGSREHTRLSSSIFIGFYEQTDGNQQNKRTPTPTLRYPIISEDETRAPAISSPFE